MSNSARIAENMKKQVLLRANEIRQGVNDQDMMTALVENHNAAIQALLSLDNEDAGWLPWQQYFSEEKNMFSLTQTKEVALKVEEFTKTNPLLGQGLRLRTNYALGRGFDFEYSRGELPPRFKRIIADAENEAAVFGNTAYRKHNRSLYTGGNLFAIWDTETRKVSIVPLDKVTNRVSHDLDRSQLKYIQVTYNRENDLSEDTANAAPIVEWIPTDGYWISNNRGASLAGVRLPAPTGYKTKTIAVSHKKVIIDLRVNRGENDVWGIPDAFAAVPWAWASSEYLKDGGKLLKALGAIALHVKAKTITAAKNFGARVERNRVGGTAITGPDTEVSVMPRGNAVDLYTGRPIQSMVASALSVSVTALTSDTGKGGSYGSETTLQLPELLATLARQEEFADWTRRIFAVMGIEDGNQNFRPTSVDPAHRIAQTALVYRTGGAINQEEFRGIALEQLAIVGDPSKLPQPDEFTGSKYTTLRDAIVADALADPDLVVTDPNPRQGNSGVGSLTDPGELRDTDDAL